MLRARAGAAARKLRRMAWQLGRGRYCPVCEKSAARFVPHGIRPEPERRCLHCGSLERHRMLWTFFTRRSDLFDGKPKRVIHFAPEPCISQRLSARLGNRYLSADLQSSTAMFLADLTDLPFKDGVFDVVICSHVLEHIPDDRRAMAEIRRVLKPTGWAAVLVPIIYPEHTDEDLSITDPEERLRRYFYPSHLRAYGEADFAARLRGAGMSVELVRHTDLLSEAERASSGVNVLSGDVFLCTPASA